LFCFGSHWRGVASQSGMTGIMGRTGRTWCCHVKVDVGVEMEVEVERGGVMVLGDGVG
jgi:hypothetical protein